MTDGAARGLLRLGVNIDHVATVRNARGGPYPEPLRAAKLAEAAGADGITAHLREDRRHITDADIEALMAELTVPLNLEMAATDEMQAIALHFQPHAVCIVPERREERTTEGGLEVAQDENRLAHFIAPLRDAGCRVSIFIAADRRQIEAAHRIGAPVIELHTGAYCEADLAGDAEARAREMARLADMATFARGLGLEVHAGHGLTFDNVGPVAALPELKELNIGHFLVGEAIFVGLDAAIRRMRAADGRGAAGRGEHGLSGDVVISPVRSDGDVAAAVALFRAYADSLDVDLSYQDFAGELAAMPGRYAPPAGALLLARDGAGAALGCVGLRPMDEAGVAEMKRLFVRPEGRGRGLGAALVEAIVAAAARIGYREIRLDTLPSMAGAIALYERAGFVRTAPYYDTPIAGTVFFARRIGPGPVRPGNAQVSAA